MRRPLTEYERMKMGEFLDCIGYPYRPVAMGFGSEVGRTVPIWPIEEYLARSKHKPTVAERIRRLNPDGKPEGLVPRGLHKKRTVRGTRSEMNLVSRQEYDAKWGRGAHRKLLRDRRRSLGGRRWAITMLDYMEGPSA